MTQTEARRQRHGLAPLQAVPAGHIKNYRVTYNPLFDECGEALNGHAHYEPNAKLQVVMQAACESDAIDLFHVRHGRQIINIELETV